MHFRHVKVREDKIPQAMAHFKILFKELDVNEKSIRHALPVDHVDQCPVTDKKRVHFVDKNRMAPYGWLYEEFVEDIHG